MRVKLGSETRARQAREMCARISWSARFVQHEGEWWSLLGMGAARVVLLGPDGVVYKVSHGNYSPDYHRWERDRFENNQHEPWCPEFWSYDDVQVMAMRRYEQDPARIDPEEFAALSAHFVGEVAIENVGLTEDGRLVLLDGGDEP